jgi:hypothetical protein
MTKTDRSPVHAVIFDSRDISDSGRVRIGDFTPAFPPPVRGRPADTSDSGKVRIGDFSPAFPPPVRGTPSNTKDSGKVRIGDFSPAFPSLRSR